MTKGIVYYTDNRCQERIMSAVRNRLNWCKINYPLVSVSQYPMDFGHNVVIPCKPSILSMFKQILEGLHILTTDFVFLTEHDVLYHPCHFDFEPRTDDTYYYNTNVWTLNSETGEALHYDGMRKTSCLVANRELLIDHYTKKIAYVEKHGFSYRLGFEPGKRNIDAHGFETYNSAVPNIDIKHGNNIMPWRGKLSQYRNRRRLESSWQLSDSIPYWGKTLGRFDDFLREVAY